ncbi:hypothetical protein SPRG_13721 [Saprolegnia parasitica CBS 223.65]|uniref:Uncharacterized protein n=1 Tax=Saprolegnia parasitica (strain CBS 223.65) TaxID=695850 RepID=A0A067C3W4_SAPPC|nr:hypothetical protein SPRG_13721 [Saprolegnia parasitica CBS 223.65]KDO21221.1 hypothetical protein SPRG_13721 [Saprolegnia parasitica CBS 223.65]|eukprot:XP_012208054.1 hypothetical protein SPRG_13721 [Saprolegnia parasitica CBS 223.65]
MSMQRKVLGTEESASLHEPATHGPPSPESPSQRKSIQLLLFSAKTETVADDHDVEAPIDIAMVDAPAIDSQRESAATIVAESEGEDDTASGDEASLPLESTAPSTMNDDPCTPDEAVASRDALLGATASPGKYIVNADEAHDELATSSDEADETYSPNAAFLSRDDVNGGSDVDEMDEALSDVDEPTDGRGSAEDSERSPRGPEGMTNRHSFEHRTDDTPSSDGWDASSSAHAVSLNDVRSATGRIDKCAHDDEALDTKDDHMITSAPRAEARMAAQDAQKDFTNSHQNEHEDDLEDDDAAVLRATMDGVANMAAAESLDEDLSSSESDADEAPMPNEVLSHTNVQPTERSVPQAADGDASDEEEVMALQQSAPMGAQVTLASLRRAVDSDDDEFDHEVSRPPTAAGDDHSFNMDEETNAAGSAHDASADQVRDESRDVDTLADDNSFDMEYDDVVPTNDVDPDSSDDEGVTTALDLQPVVAEMSQGNYRDTSDVDATSLKTDQTTPLVVGGDASLAPAHDISLADDEVGDDEAFSDDEVLSEADANEPSVEEAQTEEVEHLAPATIHAHREASKDAPSVHADASDDLDENDESVVEAAQPLPVHAQESSELRLGSGHEETLRHADPNAASSEPHDDSGDDMDDDGPLSDPEDDEDDESLNVSTPSPTDTDAASRIPETAAVTETETFETTAAPLGKDQAHVAADVTPLQTKHEYDDAEELSSSDGEDDMDIDESIEASEDDPSADISTGIRSSMTARFDDDEAVLDDSLEASGDDENSFDASGHTLEPPSAETHGDGIPLTSSVVDNGLSDPVSTRHLDDDQKLSDADDHELSDVEALSDGEDETSVDANHREATALSKTPLDATASLDEPTLTTRPNEGARGVTVVETHVNAEDENDDSDDALSDVEDAHDTLSNRSAASSPNATATAPMHVGDDCEEALSDEESASDFDSSFDAPNPTPQSPPVEPHFHDASPMSPNDVATRNLMVEVSPPMENDDDDAPFEANDKAYLVDDDDSSFDAVVAAPLTTPHGVERYDNLTTDRHDVMHPVAASSTQFDDEDEVLSDPEDDGDAIDSSFDASAMTPDELRAFPTEKDANPTTDRHDATRPVVQMSTHFDDEDEALSDPEDDVDGDDGRYDAPVVTTDEPRVPSPESHDNSTTDHDDTMHPVAAASSAHYDAEDEALSDAEDDINAIDGSIGAPVATSDELRVSPTENHANSTAGHHEAMRPVDQPSSHFDDEDEALSDPEGDVDGIDNSFDAPATMASEPLVASAKSYVNSTVHLHEAARPVVQTPTHFDDEDEALSGGEDEADGIDNSFDAPATMVTRGEPRVPSTESHNYPTTDRHDAMRPVDQPSAHFDDEDEALSGAEDEVDGIDNSFDAPMVTKSEPRVSPTESHVNRTTDLNDAMRPVAASSTHFDDADEALSNADDQDLLDTKDDGNAIDSSFDAPLMPQHTSSTEITDGTDSNGRVIDDRVPSLVVERNTIDDDGGYEALSDPDDESFGDVEHGSNGLSEAPARPTFAVDDPVDADALSDDESGVGAPKSSVPLASSRPSDTSFDDASDVDDDDDDVTAPLQGADAASIDAASRRLLTTAHYDDADDLSSESDDEPPAKSHPVYDDGGEDVSDSDADDTTDVTSTPLTQTPSTTNESAQPNRSSAMEDDEDEEEVETPLPSRAPTGGLPPVASRFGTMANAHDTDDEDLDEVERLMQGHLQGRATDNSFDFDDGEDVENSFDAPDNTTTVSHARSANEEDELSDSEDRPPTASVPNHHGSLGHETGPASQPATASVVSSSVPPPTAQRPTDEEVELDDSDEELSTKRNEPVPRHVPQAAPLRSIASQLPPVASTLGRHAPLGAKAPLAALHAGDTEDDLDEVERLMRDHVTTHASLASRTAADADFDDSFDAQEASGDDDDNDDALSDPDEATAAFNAVTQREDTLSAGKRMPLAPLTKPLPPIGAAQESSFDDASPSKLSALDRALLPSGDALHIHTPRCKRRGRPPRFDDGEDVDGSSRDDQAASFSPSPVTQPSSAPPHDDDDAYSDSFDMEESIDESVASDEDATS